ncbi:MAG: sigma-70 family RNA polymerase sigma factor [Akkermansiaceae bacterium]|jgi:RNA polymerase sigma-70 factor (ECF subfamily)|nr:sigma-70 family RNA polymerase sigma factor [Akkermansiaceae bacterium]
MLILSSAASKPEARKSRRMPGEPEKDPSSEFLGHMLRSQRSIRNYIFSLHPYAQDLDDLFQQTALTLWREFEKYDATREFLPWALRISYFEVLRLRKKQSRDRLVFSEDFIELMASDCAEDPSILIGPHRHALDTCLAKLDSLSREVLMARYSENATVSSLASIHRISIHRLYRLLDSARASLVACVRRQLHSAGESFPSESRS